MKLALIAITDKGTQLAINISKNLNVDLFLFNEYKIANSKELKRPLSSNIKTIFNEYDGIIFIMAAGIVVRIISPYIISKISDPAVVVLDELGKFVISLLSGHIGGANELAIKIADITGGQPVITTSTDINNAPAIDVIAKKNNCYIQNINQIKYINKALANSQKISIFTQYKVENSKGDYITVNPTKVYNQNVVISTELNKTKDKLYLIPRILVLGIGCKKNTSLQDLDLAIKDFMDKNNRDLYSIAIISSIDLKSNERCILDFCNNYNIEFKVFNVNELKSIEDKFSISTFVKKSVGVGNVCETSAYLASNKGKQIATKTKYTNITLALFEKEYKIII